jgi:hypothetical protein
MDLSPEHWKIPSGGTEVSIISVVDERQFTATRSTRALPSLDPARSSEVGYRARAIGRHNNGSEVLLRVGRSVEDVARETVTAAFNREGFRVVPLRDGSLPVEVVIERFWGWTSGNWVIFYHFDAGLRLEVRAPDGVREVRANRDLRLGSWGSNVNMRWKSTMARGLNELVEEMRSGIRNQLRDLMSDAGSTHPTRTRLP